MDRLFKTYGRLLAGTELGFTRYLYDQINWDNRLIIIKGARGVGKTTSKEVKNEEERFFDIF